MRAIEREVCVFTRYFCGRFSAMQIFVWMFMTVLSSAMLTLQFDAREIPMHHPFCSSESLSCDNCSRCLMKWHLQTIKGNCIGNISGSRASLKRCCKTGLNTTMENCICQQLKKRQGVESAKTSRFSADQLCEIQSVDVSEQVWRVIPEYSSTLSLVPHRWRLSVCDTPVKLAVKVASITAWLKSFVWMCLKEFQYSDLVSGFCYFAVISQVAWIQIQTFCIINNNWMLSSCFFLPQWNLVYFEPVLALWESSWFECTVFFYPFLQSLSKPGLTNNTIKQTPAATESPCHLQSHSLNHYIIVVNLRDGLCSSLAALK